MKHLFLTNKILFMSIWLINGIVKLFNIIPRHREIVQTKTLYAKELTMLIGALEILMAFWILSNIKQKINAYSQITIIALMNCIEFFITPHLLLWGKLNSVFALLLILVIFTNNFYLNKTTKPYAFKI